MTLSALFVANLKSAYMFTAP